MMSKRGAVWVAVFVCSCALLAGCATTSAGPPQRQDWREDDFAWIRGANYTPSYAGGSLAFWDEFDADVVDRELGYAESVDLNCVRVFLQMAVYERDPERFLDCFEQFLALCDKHHMTAMPVLFDSIGADAKPGSSGWTSCPGHARIIQGNWPGCERYVRDVVTRYIGDQRIALWDVMNEPLMGPTKSSPGEEHAQSWRFVRHFVAFVNGLDPTHATTVGVARSEEENPQVLDLVRVVSIHSYQPAPEEFRTLVREGRALAASVGKPAIISEFGHYGTGQFYEMPLRILAEERMGFFFWELMIGKTPFAGVTGIFYPDGTLRTYDEVGALLGFGKKPPLEQLYPMRYMTEEELLDGFREALAAPTRPWNVERRLTLLHSAGLVEALARRRAEAARQEGQGTDLVANPLEHLAKWTDVVYEMRETQEQAAALAGEGRLLEAFQALDEKIRAIAAKLGIGQ